MRKTHPQWVDEYTKSIHQAYVGMVPGDWGPIDFYAGYRALNGAFIKKLHEAVVRLKTKKVPLRIVAKDFLSPSSIRPAFSFAAYEYGMSDHTTHVQAREVFDYFDKLTRQVFKKDVWAQKSNIIHTSGEVDKLIKRIPWEKGNSDVARLISRLGNSASALAYALYRDFYVDESQEVYGPYDVSKKFGRDHALVIKHYPKMRPTTLWPSMRSFRYTDMKLYMMYEGVQVKCEFIGMHTLYKGDVMGGLRKYAVEIDGVFYRDQKKMKEVMEYIGKRAVKQWSAYEKMSKQDLKMKFLEWMCFSCSPLFHLAGMDARPSEEMIRNVMKAKIGDRCVVSKFPTYAAFLKRKDWEAYWLRDLYKI